MKYLIAAVSTLLLSFNSVVSLSQERILVVGAGFAGLKAAKDLHEEGYDVTVLEARNRVGGRIYTDRSTGIAFDMGASWIHGLNNNPITALANQIGAPLSSKTQYDNFKEYDYDGTPNPLTAEQDEEFERWMNQTSKRAFNKREKVSFKTKIEEAWNDGDFDYLDNRRQLDYLVNVYLEHEFAADVSTLSAQSWWEGEDLTGGDKVFPNGYDQLTNHLAQSLDIRLNTVVTDVAYNSSGVTITTSNGTFSGDRAVITLPIGVLKSGDVSFTPQLPNAKRNAINNMEMSALNKVWMIFPHAFWDVDKQIIGYIGEGAQSKHFAEWYYFDEVAQGNVLLGFNAGEYGEEIENHSDQEIIDEAMDTLRVIYGNNIPEPTDYVISRWKSDPYAKGSYASLGEKSVAKTDRNRLRSAVNNRLFFAGEHTSSEYPATTQGAYLEGEAAANAIKSL